MTGNRDLFSKIMLGFGFIMVAVFIGIGLSLIFLPKFNYLPLNMRYVVGLFFIAYGLFRIARIINQIREQKRKEYNDE